MLHDPNRPAGILDVVPTYRSVGVHFNPVISAPSDIEQWLATLAEVETDPASQSMAPQEELEHVLPVAYTGKDLSRVARHAGLSPDEVIERHTSPCYIVAMVGFIPHFPYLLGLDKSIATPRLQRPRKRVPAGSVAIGGSQTGIYPEASPGGWNLLGTTDPALCRTIKPGHRVRFVEESR